MRLVHVEWVDAAMGPSGWSPTTEIAEFEPEPCKSVGWELARDKSRIVLAATMGGADCGQTIVILTPWVTRIVELKAPK